MIYVFLAKGFEEMEALAPVDVLRRANIEVKTVGVTGKQVRGSHGISVTCDIVASEAVFDNLDGIILPGGLPGTTNLEADETVQKFIDYAAENGKIIGAICAAPMILGHKGLLRGKNAVCYTGFEKELEGATISEKYVVTDGKFITAKGAGVATEFGLKIVSVLKSKELADEIGKAIQMK